MSSTTLRFYTQTLAHQSSIRDRRIRELHKRLRVRVSRRRFKQITRSAISRILPTS